MYALVKGHLCLGDSVMVITVMEQEVANSEEVTEGLADPATPARSTPRPVEYSYSREWLLSFADLESCKKRPENLDPVVWRDTSAADGTDGGISIPAISSRGLVRRDREGEVFSKSPVDIPEWRKDSWRSGGSGASLPQGPRRKPYDEEPPGNAFSTSYPPRPATNWGDNGHPRSSYERPGLQGQGSGRWEHRPGLGDREREAGRSFQKWDGEEIVPVPIVPSDSSRPEGPRPFGSSSPVVRPGWIPAERDGLLGSGGGLHRTYTGNFTTPSALRVGPERQLSMGPPERQTSMGRLLVRNMEPFQTSRPSKGPAFVRREDTDFVNDETFGSEENSTDDRAEQERKRRESFELMRKDHHRFLQKQQKLLNQKQEERLANPETNANRKHDESTLWDSTLSPEGMSSSPPRSPEKHLTGSEEAISGGGVSIPIVAPSTPRPAIPPGFARVVQQKQTTSKASFTSETPLEVDNLDMKETKQTGLQSESVALLQGNVVDDANKVDVKLVDSLEQQLVPNSSASMTLSDGPVAVNSPPEVLDNISERTRTAARASDESRDEWNFRNEVIADDKKQGIPRDQMEETIFVGVDEYNQSQESLLDKWFGGSKSGKGSVKDEVLPSQPVGDERQSIPQKEDSWSGVDSRMSKFAQWFNSEENQSIEHAAVSSDILSLFSKGSTTNTLSFSKEQAVQEAPQRANSINASRNHGQVLPMPSGPSLEDIEKGLTAIANTPSGLEPSVTKGLSFLSALSLKNLDVEPKGDTLSGIFGEHSPVGKFKFPSAPPRMHSPSKSSPVFLTCEDIEQSILAEAGTSVERSISKAAQPSRSGATANRKDGLAGGHIADSAASRHLLSLLQKGAGLGKHPLQVGLSSHAGSVGSPAKVVSVSDGYYDGDDWGRPSTAQEVGTSSKAPPSDNTTLEALFGKAFMSELRSVEAPLSANAFANDYSSNTDGTQASSGVYTPNRQSSGPINSPANANIPRQWPGTIGPLSRMGWTESNVLDINRQGNLTDLHVPRSKPNHYVTQDKEESRPVSSSGHVLWGNGVSINSHIPEGSLPINSVGNKGSFVSSMDSNSFVLGDVTDNSAKVKGHLSRVPSSDLDILTSSKINGDGKSVPSGNFMSGQLRASEDSTSALSQAKVLSSDEPIVGPITSFDSSGILHVSKEEGVTKRLVGDAPLAKFGSAELSAISREETTPSASQGIENFLSTSRKLGRKEILEDTLREKVGLSDDMSYGNDRKVADTLGDTYGFTGKAKDGSVRASTSSTAGLPEQGNAGLGHANSASNRFKLNAGTVQPTPGFSSFQPVQHQQSIGAMYRSDSSPSLSLQSRQQGSIPHHHLQPNPNSGTLSMFPPQFHPQAGLPQQQQLLPQQQQLLVQQQQLLSQQQQLLPRSFSNGASLEFPHVAFGHSPSAPNRPLPGGHMHFLPSPHGHLSPPGAYHPMGHMGPAPNHFLAPGQMSQRGPVMSPMADAHVFMQEQSLLDPHSLSSKAGQQQGPSLFPLGGHALQSGQGPLFHQPLPHNLRGQQNQLLPGHSPWVVPYSSDLMRTASKGHEMPGYANASGVAVGGGVGALDRWFGMELSRNVSGIPSPGLVQHSSHGLDSESKMRFG